METKVLLLFDVNAKVAIMQGNVLVHYATCDYSKDTLSFLYGILNGIKIDQVIVCLPETFSEEPLQESTSMGPVELIHSMGYFRTSFEDLNKIEHLLQKLGVSNIRITWHRLFKHDGDCLNVFYSGEVFELYAYKNDSLIDYSIQTESTLNDSIAQMCLQYQINQINDFVTTADLEGLPNTFCNVFAIDDEVTLTELTKMAALCYADSYSLSEVMTSNYACRELVSSIETAPATKTEDTDAPVADDDFDTPEPNKSKKKRPLFAACFIGALLIVGTGNAYMYQSKVRVATEIQHETATLQEQQKKLDSLIARCNILTSDGTKETGYNLYSLLKQKELKKAPITKIDISGGTVTLELVVKNEDKMQKYADILRNYAEVTNVEKVSEDGKEITCKIAFLI